MRRTRIDRIMSWGERVVVAVTVYNGTAISAARIDDGSPSCEEAVRADLMGLIEDAKLKETTCISLAP